MKIAQVRQIALSLPGVTEQPHFNYGSYRVGGKIFVTVAPEQKFIHVFVAEPQRERALALEPDFIEKLFWGGKVVGLRVALGNAKPRLVTELIRQAWLRKAPRKLVDALAEQFPGIAPPKATGKK